MKKFLLIFAIFLLPLNAFGFEDYIIVSDKPVELISSGDNEILEVSPFFTIDNNKNCIFVKIKKEGNCPIFITTKDGINTIDVKISPEKTVFSKKDGFEYFPLDKPESSERVNSASKIREAG